MQRVEEFFVLLDEPANPLAVTLSVGVVFVCLGLQTHDYSYYHQSFQSSPRVTV
ncbi:hypothetical protein MBEHAL_1089 [Halarchaeum acidiphilum MH1-52-1]|uniref:Uncharacterized protein n=1 Tax=Halarchaeum acidiphilum MH1-52-1 TaxID=1261545 RepID=U3A3Y4_9EURY|nr:hypothetical protein MBEHAL_1089 [Halarchaeum acidiphilum MH1-52-1]